MHDRRLTDNQGDTSASTSQQARPVLRPGRAWLAAWLVVGPRVMEKLEALLVEPQVAEKEVEQREVVAEAWVAGWLEALMEASQATAKVLAPMAVVVLARALMAAAAESTAVQLAAVARVAVVRVPPAHSRSESECRSCRTRC